MAQCLIQHRDNFTFTWYLHSRGNASSSRFLRNPGNDLPDYTTSCEEAVDLDRGYSRILPKGVDHKLCLQTRIQTGLKSSERKNNPVSHRVGPGSIPRQLIWDLWWTKWRSGRFSPSTSVSLANLQATNCSTITITYHPVLVVADVTSGLSLTPPQETKKKYSLEGLLPSF
jgi:hypothetical protein